MSAPEVALSVASAAEPTPETIRRARVYWEQGQADLKEARRLLRTRSSLTSSYLSFQAALNALTCLCHLHGEFRVPNFSLPRLLAVLEEAGAGFPELQAVAEALEAAQELNPYAATRDAEEEQRQARLYYAHGDSILKTVRGYLRTHRRRFFAP